MDSTMNIDLRSRVGDLYSKVAASPARNLAALVIRIGSLALLLTTGIGVAQDAAQGQAIAGEPVLELYTGHDHFVAEVNEGLYIALVLEPDGSLIGYLCDGEEVSEWFNGVFSGQQALVDAGEGTRINLTVSDEGVDGTVALNGNEQMGFSAVPAITGAGLQRLETPLEDGGIAVSGWVTLNDGSQRGIICIPPYFLPPCTIVL